MNSLLFALYRSSCSGCLVFILCLYGVFSFIDVLIFNVIEIVNIFLYGILLFAFLWQECFYTLKLQSYIFSILVVLLNVLFFTSKDLIYLVLIFVYDEVGIVLLFIFFIFP